MGSSWTRARTRVPCIGRQILNHCATREAQNKLFNTLILQALYPSKLIEEITEQLSNTVQLLLDQCCKIELSLMMEMASMVSARHLRL